MAKLYEGRNALITGGTGSVGMQLAEHLVKNGARVVLCDLSEEAGQKAVGELNAKTGSSSPAAFFVKMDVTSWDSVDAGFKKAKELLQSKLDYVFPNAGTGRFGFPDEPGKPDTIVVDVNLTGVILTVQAGIHHFRDHNSGGVIVATSSLSGLIPFWRAPLYSATKFAVVGLVRSTAPAIRKHNIRINAVAPGGVPSALSPPPVLEWMKENGVATTHENVLRAFDILLSDEKALSGEVAEVVGDSIRIVDDFVKPPNALAAKAIQGE